MTKPIYKLSYYELQSSKPMSEEVYSNYCRKVEELCFSCGLKKVKTTYPNEINYCVTNSLDFIYGEVIRLFVYNYNDKISAYLCFFNKLQVSQASEVSASYSYKYNPSSYKYIYGYFKDYLPKNLSRSYMDNTIMFVDLDKEEIFNDLKIIIVDAVQQYKKLMLNNKLDRINQDF